ncbi:c-type cytochrome [Pelagibacterium montanilacus]|uniref:c-type cytochrome n=1 Tax=Pelagibacterium montanilacus TaxID=2185280 RepID=UPI000F8E7FCE|nr:c-type cytochrome [Pelagibacterium montanilacus]
MTRFSLFSALPLAAAAFWTGSAAGSEELSFSQVERGRYLATASDCIGCHTDFENGAEPYAGGRGLETPFGVIYSPNLTFDDETGLGRWTRDDFYRAMNEGIDREGNHLYPAFPYPYFTLMPRQDTDAIYDYLSTLEPVHKEKPENELPFPFNLRQAILGWNTLFFEEREFVSDPEMSDEWNRGRYLVDGPAHCGACHTGKNFAGADVDEEYLRGGVLENWLAPNIRGGENGGLDDWSQAEIVQFLRTGRNDHTAALQRMGEVVVLSTQKLANSDLEAIADYLKTLDDDPREIQPSQDSAVMEAGEAIFFDSCAACHAVDGTGAPGLFAPLDGSNKVNSEDPTTVIRVILEGTQAVATDAHPGPLAMPAYDWKLDDGQIADVATYIRNAWTNSAPAVDAGTVEDLREYLSED